MKNKYLKIGYIISLILAIVFLIIGASFHGYRMNPSDVEKYDLGVLMGIIMISLFSLFISIFILLLIIYKRKMKNDKN